MAEMKLLTKYIDNRQSAELEFYESVHGYDGLKKALQMKPDDIIAEVKKVGTQRKRGRGISDRTQMVLYPERHSKTEIYHLQRGRGRTGNIQRS